MKRQNELTNAVTKVQARRRALNLPVSNIPTKVTDTTLYLVARIDGKSSIVKLTNDDTKKAIGITNFDGNRLADGRDAVIDAIRVGFMVDQTASAKMSNLNWAFSANPHPELINAELKLVQSNVVLLSLPMSDLITTRDVQPGYSKTEGEDFRHIASTPYLVSKEPIEWILEFPEGATMDHSWPSYIKIECRAIQAIQ